MRVGRKDIEATSLLVNLSIKIYLPLPVKSIFFLINLGLDFKIRKRVLIDVYSCWKAPYIAGFSNKPRKRETVIIEAV